MTYIYVWHVFLCLYHVPSACDHWLLITHYCCNEVFRAWIWNVFLQFLGQFFISLNLDEVIQPCLWLMQNVDFDWFIVCWYIELICCEVSEIELTNISVRLETSSSGSQSSMNDSANSMSVGTLIGDFSALTFCPVINSTKHDLGAISTIASNSSLRWVYWLFDLVRNVCLSACFFNLSTVSGSSDFLV